jgi:hypothetical protein
MLSDKNIETFQLLYKKHFEEEIDKDKALERGLALIQLVQAVVKQKQRNNEINTKKI